LTPSSRTFRVLDRRRWEGISEQAKACGNRLQDAKALQKAERWRGAVYLAGYAVECKLKYKLMLERGVQRLGVLEKALRWDPYRHSLDVLGARLSGWERMKKYNPVFCRAWQQVRMWQVSWRYAPERLHDLGTRAPGEGDGEIARRFVLSVEEVLRCIEANA